MQIVSNNLYAVTFFKGSIGLVNLPIFVNCITNACQLYCILIFFLCSFL